MEEHAFLGCLSYCIIWSPVSIRRYVPTLNKNLLFFEQLVNALKAFYLDCGVPYVGSVQLVKIRSNRLLHIKPGPLPPTACPTYYSLIIIMFYIARN
jgi:hypothetical protein